MKKEISEERMVDILGLALGEDDIDVKDLNPEEKKLYESMKKEIEENRKAGNKYIYDIPYD